MANILEFLRSVLTEPEAQDAFYDDPSGFVGKAGFVDLTGEDVVEAVLVLRRSLPDELAGRLAAFEDEDALPSVRPGPDEGELDAAVRVLGFAIEEAGAAPAAAASEPIDVENELDTDLAPPVAAASPTPVAVPDSADASAALERFSEALTSIVVDATVALEAAAERARAALSTSIAAADADTAELRAQGEADRDAARRDAERIRTEADDQLQRAREQADESRKRAEEMIASAEAEAAATHEELTARRAELREVERQLKERLAGIDTLFRTALGDEGDPKPPST